MGDSLRIVWAEFSTSSQAVLDVSITEQHAFKNVNNCLYANIYSYLETSGGQSHDLYLNVHFFNANVNQTSMAA